MPSVEASISPSGKVVVYVERDNRQHSLWVKQVATASAAQNIVPPADAERLKAAGVAAVYTPKDFEINAILGAIVKEVELRFDAEQAIGGAGKAS